MQLKSLTALCLSLTILPAQFPEELQHRFDDAERRIVRLPPTAFPELPRAVITELQRRACTIPQTPYTNRRQNVIKGEFLKAGQTDWAVLCSANQTPWLFSLWTDPRYISSILVFWNGSPNRAAEIATKQDRQYLQGISATEIGFSRIIGAATPEFIRRHNSPGLGLDHGGIDDSFAEKGSITWYFQEGAWTKLLGAD